MFIFPKLQYAFFLTRTKQTESIIMLSIVNTTIEPLEYSWSCTFKNRVKHPIFYLQ